MRPIGVGRPLGIRVLVDPSWFVIIVLVGLATNANFGEAYPGESPLLVATMAIATTLLFCVSLISHELGHAVLARRLGIPVRGITLFLFGGVSEISHEVRVPRDEFAIALVGPMVSVFLGGLFALISALGSLQGWAAVEGVGISLAGVNGVLALFNLVPGLPLDGGRLLRSGIWGLTGNHARSTRIAVAGGRLAALGLLVWGAVRVVNGDVFGLWFGFVALFLDGAARASGRSVRAEPPGFKAVTLSPDEGPSSQS
jgi:Zn-dependent protease